MEAKVKTVRADKRFKKRRDVSRSPRLPGDSSKESSIVGDHPDSIKLCLILQFKIQDYIEKVDFPEDLKLYWRGRASADSIHLAQHHLQEIAKLAQFDQKNLKKHVKYLNKVTNGVGFLIESTGVEFTGLTKKQVRECSSNKSLDFEVIEITC